MTSLFDQFEQASVKTFQNNNLSTAEMNNLGYIDMTLDQDLPIFTRSKRDVAPGSRITHSAIANNQLVLILANDTLLRMHLQSKKQDELSLSKYSSTMRPTNLFLDPSGNHLVITLNPRKIDNTTTPEALYLAAKSTKLKSIQKSRGHDITQLAWGLNSGSENNTGPILLGTSKGLIFETDLALDGDKFFTSTSLEQYWRQVFDIGKGTNTPITGLAYFKTSQGSEKYVIFASTPSKLYYFVGKAESDEKPLLQQVFNRYLNIPEKETYFEITPAVKYTTKLNFFSENLITPNALSWTTDQGVFYCEFILGQDSNMTEFSRKITLIKYPKSPFDDYNTTPKYPIAVTLLQFHVLLAHSDAIRAICLLNSETVYEDNYNEAFDKLTDLLKDPNTGDIWAITENSLQKFRITKEERNVWRIFAQNKQFDLAKKYARGNQMNMNQVLIKEADMLFEQREFELSAQRYAETRTSFEEIALKFLQIDQQDSLKIFLRHKLDTLEPQDKSQITMIVIWLVELYLSKLESLRLTGFGASARYADVQKEFEIFLALAEVSDCIKKNKGTIYELMASHGDQMNLIKLTIINKDFERLIRQHIYKHCYHDALEVLKSQNNYELYYQFAPILIQEIAKVTVRALIEQGRKLVALRLLPALATCPEPKYVIEYLEFCVEKLKNTDGAIHNFLISLYAKHKPDKLTQYFADQGQDITMVMYDVYFALSICQECNLVDACVHLSAILGLWEQAVDLAISASNVKLAMELADQPDDEPELRKKLWLKIAKHVVEDRNDIQQAMDFLKKCDLLRIEDILPFFPDFVTIDHFKDAICNSLNEYNSQIQGLKEEMEDATKSAELIREDIQSFRNRFTFVASGDTCGICTHILMTKPFYLFPCQHKFHKECMMAELLQLLGPAKRNKLADLERQLRLLNAQSNVETSSTGSGLSTRDMVKSEIDNIVASECLFCGENMIINIDKPFIGDQDYEKICKEWE